MPLPDVIAGSGVSVRVDLNEVLNAIEHSPKVFNQAANRALQRIGSAFAKKFTAERLRGGGIQTRRSGVPRKVAAPFQPSRPKAMQLAGFAVSVAGQEAIEGKQLRIANRSPVMFAHEHGAVISAKDKSLTVRFSQINRQFSQVKGNNWKRRDEIFGGAMIRLAKGRVFLVARRELKKRTDLIPLATLKRSVRLRPRLGLQSTWNAFLPEAMKRLGDEMAGAVRRLGGRRVTPVSEGALA